MENINKRIIAVISSILLGFCCITSCYSLCKYLINRYVRKTITVEKTENFSYSEIYPFDEKQEIKKANKISNLKQQINLYNSKINTFKKLTLNYCSKHHLLTDGFYYLYGLSYKVLNKKFVTDSEGNLGNVFKLKNGYLSLIFCEIPNIDFQTKKLKEFKEYLSSNGIDYLHVLSAEKGDERLNQNPKGMSTTCNYVFSRTMKKLDEFSINYIDTYSLLINSEENYFSYFYKTDHHWNDFAGLKVSNEIIKQINLKYGYFLDESLVDISNYTVKTYKNIMLGSLGKKTTNGYISKEDFDILTPNFFTNFTIIDKQNEINKSGSYEETLLNKSALKINNLYLDDIYETFLYCNSSLQHIENKNCNNGKKALIIKDSKGNVVVPHLANAFQYIDTIDPRSFDGSIKKLIENTKPDIVITLYTPSSSQNSFYSFN